MNLDEDICPLRIRLRMRKRQNKSGKELRRGKDSHSNAIYFIQKN